MSRRLPFHRVFLLALLATLLTGGSLLLGPSLVRYHEQQLASRLVARLLQPDATADPNELWQVAKLGSSAIEPLVCAATANNNELADQARAVIDEQLGLWQITMQSAPNSDSHRIPVELARALALHVHEFGDLGQQWAERTALELVAVAEKLPPSHAEQVLVNCSRVLEVVPATNPRLRVSNNQKPPQVASSLPVLQPQPELREFVTPSESVPTPTPHPTQSAAPQQVNPPAASEPIVTFTPALPKALDWTTEWSPGPPQPDASGLKRPTSEPRPGATKLPRSDVSTPRMVAVPDPDTMNRRLVELRGSETATLLESLKSADFYTAGVVRQVLRERGFSQEELDLAERVAQAKPSERVQLVRDLRNVQASVARRWLRQFLTDEDPDVRLEALSVLAASSDPERVSLARELAVHDRDPRIADLATRIMQDDRK